MIRGHIDTMDTLLAGYAAGMLPKPARVLVESHLELKSESRTFVSGLESLAGEIMTDLPPTPINAETRGRMLDAVYASHHDAGKSVADAQPAATIFPPALRAFLGFDVDGVRWRTRLPGFKEHKVGDIEGCSVSLFWIRPGRSIPAHTHRGHELSLVLDGDFSDAFGHYARGDISVAAETVDHRPTAGHERPCIGLAVVDAPLRFTGPFGQFLRDLIG